MFAGPKIYLIQGYIRKLYMEVIIDMEKAGKFFLFFFLLLILFKIGDIIVWFGLLDGPANICVLIINKFESYLRW